MKYHIETYGCQMNQSDSERIASFLEKSNHKPAKKMEAADLIIVNMCSVRQSAVDRVFGISQKLARLKNSNPKLKTILSGCILKSDRKKFKGKFDEIWENKENKNYQNISLKCRDNKMIFIPISNGCNNFCTYCVVPYARGRLICRSHKDIIKEIKNTIKRPRFAKAEVWFLGQNVNDYQSPSDPLINFARLLEKINNIPGNFKIRFMSPNPKNFSDGLIDVMTKCKKVAKYLNLPVQSGDDKILKAMNRPYTSKQYRDLVKKIRNKIPDINLSTDIIVGFPGETKKQFENTVKLFKDIKFNIAYISKYSPRPGTIAFKMKDNVPHKEKEKRWKILNDIILKNKRPILIFNPKGLTKIRLK